MTPQTDLQDAHNTGLLNVIYIAIGAVAMKAGDLLLKFYEKRWGKKRDIADLKGIQIQNEKCIFENLERINNLLSKQLEANVQKYLDIMNINITLKGENSDLREKVQLMQVEIKVLKKQIKDFEIEVEKLKKYIIENKIELKSN